MTDYPVLYSFRRCPFAMRARMALFASGQTCELREVLLRDKPLEMIAQSPKATVPVLVLDDTTVLEESLDIMHWALARHDPQHWLTPEIGDQAAMMALVAECDGDFKEHLDRYKYAPRYEDVDPLIHRAAGEKFLSKLNDQLADQAYLCGTTPSFADYAIAPFIRQFANTDRNWFDAAPYRQVQAWLESILTTEPFIAVMTKYPVWQAGDTPTLFAESKFRY